MRLDHWRYRGLPGDEARNPDGDARRELCVKGTLGRLLRLE